jgi:hypothetical protein
MLRQLGPYEKTTWTINNYCCLIYFFNLHQNIWNCLYFDWLFTHYVVMSDFYLRAELSGTPGDVIGKGDGISK